MFSALLFTLLATAAQFALLVIGSPIAGDAPFPLKARAPQNFVHPGIVIGQEQLDFVKSKVQAKQSPWFDAYQSLLTSRFGDLTRESKPRAVVDCGFYNKPDNGCTDESHDALTAYGTALLWYVTGEQKFADRSISIMNDWSKVLTAHTNQNAPVQAGWAAASWVKAAEIIRYSNAGWGDDDIQQFKKMLEEVYLPIVIPGSSYNGNWELGTQNPLLFLLLLLCNFPELVCIHLLTNLNHQKVMMEAAQGISVFNEDRDSYDKAMQKFLGRAPAYVYLTSDGPYPKIAPDHKISTREEVEGFWFGQKVFGENGIAQETCRDFCHLGSGLSSMAHIAETSRLQGWDLLKETDVGDRLKYGLEFNLKYQMQPHSVPDWLCNGKINSNMGPGMFFFFCFFWALFPSSSFPPLLSPSLRKETRESLISTKLKRNKKNLNSHRSRIQLLGHTHGPIHASNRTIHQTATTGIYKLVRYRLRNLVPCFGK